MKKIPAILIWPLLALLLAGCTPTRPALQDRLPAGTPSLELADTPFIAQDRFQCGPAALAMLLQASGVETSADALAPRVYIPKLKGSLQAEMVAATRELGRMPYRIEPNLPALLAELRLGRPVLVLQNLAWDFYPVWHYAVVIGYDAASDQLILRSGTTRRKFKSTEAFLDDWRRGESWALIALLPGSLPADPSPERYLLAAAGLESAGKTEAAALAYASAVKIWPDAPAAWLGLGNSRYAQDDLAGARRAYEQALQRAPEAPVVLNNLAQVLAEQGCRQDARRLLERALRVASADLKTAINSTLQEIDRMPESAGSCPAG